MYETLEGEGLHLLYSGCPKCQKMCKVAGYVASLVAVTTVHLNIYTWRERLSRAIKRPPMVQCGSEP